MSRWSVARVAAWVTTSKRVARMERQRHPEPHFHQGKSSIRISPALNPGYGTAGKANDKTDLTHAVTGMLSGIRLQRVLAHRKRGDRYASSATKNSWAETVCAT
jgi:hypothetical protein